MPEHDLDGYATLPDYILGITERIWEERGIHLIRRWYADDCLVHTPSGPFRGAGAMVAGTLETLHAFPDRQLLAEDVIWSDDGPALGLLSSHRVASTGRHLGGGLFGPPTGRAMTTRTVADCRVVGHRIVEEWLVRDQAGIALQLGLDPVEHGRRLAAEDAVHGAKPWHLDAWEAVRRGECEASSALQDHPAAVAVREALMAIVGTAELSALRRTHDRAVQLTLPCHRHDCGIPALDGWLIGLLAAMPDARIAVDHSIALEEPGRPLRVATRWRMAGTHSGRGSFGAPTGARLLIPGITHSDLVGGKVVREYWVVDELSVHRMIGLQAG
jgi:predicted ester cyclase